MKAIRFDRYGLSEVLELRDVDVPPVGDDELLVRVRAASVNPLEWHFMPGYPYLVRMVAGCRGPGPAPASWALTWRGPSRRRAGT